LFIRLFGDVETIRHPKNELKKLYPGFDEVKNGGCILDCLNVEHFLSRLIPVPHSEPYLPGVPKF
jgi:hypothetical protein